MSNIFWRIFLEGILKRKDISMILREAKSQTIILLYTKKHDQRSKRIFPTNWFYCCSNLKRLHSNQIALSQILDHPLFQYHYFKLHSYLINALIFLFGARLLQRRNTMFFCFEFISQT